MKTITAFILSIIISTISIFYGEKHAKITTNDSQKLKTTAKLKKIEYVNPDIYAYPVIIKKELVGYFICKFSFEIDAEVNYEFEVDEKDFLTDIFYQSAFESQIFIREGDAVPDVAKVADIALAKSNEVSVSKRYLNVLIQQVDYFDRTEVRRKIVEEREVER